MKEIVNSHIAAIVSKIMLWVGIVIILSSVGYAIFNLPNIDNYITIWATLMAIGTCFSIISLLLHIMIKPSDKKECSFIN